MTLSKLSIISSNNFLKTLEKVGFGLGLGKYRTFRISRYCDIEMMNIAIFAISAIFRFKTKTLVKYDFKIPLFDLFSLRWMQKCRKGIEISSRVKATIL